ncbi:hypothetical protein LOK49_LG04G00990 [Camellia lanceoleosa]|uniref:Uncharacterized protein n=1 Tax=Camellia lanceoleosa TaxID=1840588 RepID=A0ACC0I2V8_9ERIC|nr:hypothetical protein LOK49_LG04G00990 [Camellia lanceoleosa]
MNAKEDVLLHGLADNDTFLKQMGVNSHTGEGMDCSNLATQRACESSAKKKDNKRSRSDDDVVEELSMFANKLVDVMGKTNEKLEFIEKMMGYSHDVASKRASLNDELTKLPITVNERLDACEIISHDVQKLDMFFNLTNDDRLRWGALAHPYLTSLHDISHKPICTTLFSFDFEQHALSEEQMKELIYREALAFNQEYQQIM